MFKLIVTRVISRNGKPHEIRASLRATLIKPRDLCRSWTHPFDHRVTVEENHVTAALSLVKATGASGSPFMVEPLGAAVDGSEGYLFVLVESGARSIDGKATISFGECRFCRARPGEALPVSIAEQMCASHVWMLDRLFDRAPQD